MERQTTEAIPMTATHGRPSSRHPFTPGKSGPAIGFGAHVKFRKRQKFKRRFGFDEAKNDIWTRAAFQRRPCAGGHSLRLLGACAWSTTRRPAQLTRRRFCHSGSSTRMICLLLFPASSTCLSLRLHVVALLTFGSPLSRRPD